MSIAKAFNAPYVLVLEGKEYKFARFSPPEVAELAATIKAHKIADGKRILDECQVKGIERVQMLRYLSDEPETEQSVFNFAATPAGAIKVAKQSLKKAGASDEFIGAAVESELTVPDLTIAALEVVGFAFDELPKADAEKKPETPAAPTSEPKP